MTNEEHIVKHDVTKTHNTHNTHAHDQHEPHQSRALDVK